MSDSYYSRAPPEFDRLAGGPNYAKIYRPPGGSNGDQEQTNYSTVPMGDVITEQPGQNQGYGQPSNAYGQLPVMSPVGVGIPLPGLDILDRIPFIKVHKHGILSGGTICTPGYKVQNVQGDLMLKGTSDILFCPFDSKYKTIYIKDLNEECIFQIKFLPSVCECDSEEKRCFAVYCPHYENPFGAILFESGQLKYSLKILNALEAETYAVQFLGNSDISIKGADGTIVGIINIQKKRGESQKYTLTFTEELSSANKALFIGCIITLDLVNCEADCSKVICLSPFVVGTLTILGLTLGSYDDDTKQHPGKPS